MTKARSNATAPAAKGEIVVGTGSDVSGILGVGNSGETLVADSSATTGLRWQADWNTGKNKIINGDFGIWQRGTSFTATTGTAWQYYADRFQCFNYGGSTLTVSRQTFTPGSAPVAGYEGAFFMRLNSTGTSTTFQTTIEDVRTFAGQTVTVSMWLKSASPQTITTSWAQVFGSGGSSAVTFYNGNFASITTSWARYSYTVTIPSISGKTIGTNNYLAFQMIGAINNELDVWGVQVEAGSVATPFTTATGTLAGELAACQRYYVRFNDSTNSRANIGSAIPYSSTNALALVYLPVTMRVAPTAIEWANLETSDVWAANQTLTTVTLASTYASNKTLGLDIAFGGSYTNYRPYFLRQANNTAGYLGVIAEL